jgi:hypothetical protein
MMADVGGRLQYYGILGIWASERPYHAGRAIVRAV